MPLPPWDGFEETDLRDRPRNSGTRSGRGPSRSRVPWPRTPSASTTCAATPSGHRDRLRLPSSLLQEWIDAGHPYVAELARIRDVEFVDLPTGHWPQFTKPAELAAAILSAVDRTA